VYPSIAAAGAQATASAAKEAAAISLRIALHGEAFHGDMYKYIHTCVGIFK